MLKKLNIKGLKFRIWIYFVLFAAIILGALWLLQIVFLNSFYTGMKKNELQKLAQSITADYEASGSTDLLSKQYFDSGITVRVYNQSGVPQLQQNDQTQSQNQDPNQNQNQNQSQTQNQTRMTPQFSDPKPSEDFIGRIKESQDGTVCYTATQPWSGDKMLIYGATLSNTSGESLYLYVSTKIDLSDSPAAVLQTQLIIVMVISLLLSVVISLIIALRLTRPMTKIISSASALAKGNYEVTFEKGGYSEINQLASTLNYATQELSKTDQLRRDLIANVSHDLRTPLTLVKMYAELIRDVSGETAKRRNEHAQIIIDETDRLSTLITDMLDLSKIQSGTAQISQEPFNLYEKTQTILNRFHALSERDGYSFHISSGGDTEVVGDEKKIEQVIYNLISNAVNYTGEDKTISIQIEGAGEHVYFGVSDTGSGISEEELDQIWEKYYKATKANKRAIVGTGLGLSIVKGILELHHADYGVESSVGKGSTFWFELAASSNK